MWGHRRNGLPNWHATRRFFETKKTVSYLTPRTVHLEKGATRTHISRDDFVHFDTLEQAFVLAAVRRCFRAPDATALSPIRSMHYFVPVIEEVLNRPLDPAYVEYLKAKLNILR